MSKCSNCGTQLTCGCQKRVAADGRACCSNCIANYSAGLKSTTPPATKATVKSPSHVKAIYRGPGQQTK